MLSRKYNVEKTSTEGKQYKELDLEPLGQRNIHKNHLLPLLDGSKHTFQGFPGIVVYSSVYIIHDTGLSSLEIPK